jgi:L-asparagine transporter-like permease
MYPWPHYSENTFLLMTSVYSITYIILGNVAANSLIFGVRVLQAAGISTDDQKRWEVTLIAVAAVTVSCGIHATSRTIGIFLSNLFAVIKVLLLFMMIVVGCVAWAQGFKTEVYATENLTANRAFATVSTNANSNAQAFVAVLYAWGGIDQPNSVRVGICQCLEQF